MARFNATFKGDQTFGAGFGQTQVVSTSNYEELYNKPKIQGNTVIGDKTFVELGLGEITPQDIDDMFDDMIYGRS